MNQPAKTALTIAYGRPVEDRIKALMNGAVRIEGCSVRFVPLMPGEMLFRSFNDPEFNVAELSLSNYVMRRMRGDSPYVAMPAYISRSFRHGDIYVRTDRGITKPGDLRGRRVGIADYRHTAYVWSRAILEDDYGVRPADINWISARAHSHSDDDEDEFKPSVGISLERDQSGKTLSELLAAGVLDAVISPQPPVCFVDRAPRIARLFSNLEAVEDDYFQRTGILPVLHIMGIRVALAEQHPALPVAVFRALLAAKNRALEQKAAVQPGAKPALAPDRMSRLMGQDVCPYGVGPRERKTLEVFLDHHFRQGLSERRYRIEELFAPVPLAQYDG